MQAFLAAAIVLGVVISGHQWSSVVTPWMFIISGHQLLSVVINKKVVRKAHGISMTTFD